jgi:NAD(P)-dependent dehydrogenase (short-subunit alcohol dehydrogenase family)
MFNDNLLENKTIIITGGGTGLGKSMARRFGELGANLVISGRRNEVLEETANEFSKNGINVLTCPGDVRKIEDVELMSKQTIDKFGKIDALLNNAAGNFISPTEMLSQNAFKAVIDIVLMGTWNCTSVIGKEMIKNKSGNILSIVTTYAWTGSPFVVPSAAAKAGVLAMTRSLAVEWGRHNIRFNAIAPGPFPTKGAWSRLMPPGFDDFEDNMKNKIPMKRFGERHELENLASYLMSDGSAYINGEVITIDGGEWLAGAGEFSDLTKLPESMWKAMAERRKKK